MKKAKYSTETWKQHPLHPKDDSESTLNWIFIVDALNFSFWSDQPQNAFTVTVNGISYQGYWSLLACLHRAIAQGFNILDPEFYSKLSLEQAKIIFRPDESSMELMPLLQERLDVLHQIGNVLIQEYQGSFLNCLKKASCSAQSLIELLLTDFTFVFQDTGYFKDQKVYFLKKAQIVIADIWACYNGKGWGRFDDIDSVTVFADYRVPQALVYFGVLEYSSSLLNLLKQQEKKQLVIPEKENVLVDKVSILSYGSNLEIQIRGNTIWAVELLRQEIINQHVSDPPNAILIDFYIWDTVNQNKKKFDKVPFHRTRSIYY
jgi:hypothetical protein